MSINTHDLRQQHLKSLMKRNQFQAVGLNPGPDLTYLTGLNFHLMERPIVAILPQEGSLVLVLPELEAAKIANLPYQVRPFYYNEDTTTWTSVFRTALQETGLSSGQLGVIPRRLRMLELSFLKDAVPDLDLISAQTLLSLMRRIKGKDEIEKMQEAARIAECALSSTLPALKPGVTEKEIATKLVGRLFQQGSDPVLPFFPIVSFGENSANPHATPTDRALKIGDLVLIDWGAAIDGYFSDITRTFAMGDPHPELEQIARFVERANAAGRGAVKPGELTSAVDLATRKVIEDAGYGEYFIHRTGHGLGREGHEEPFISQYDQTVLEP
ncbi:MAG: Xaa-Pro peptidase family protein, partial [Anaerolineales bacterium]|nr:Xaa-Pro peptidase family protein [Anaerolineales bacterium]